MSYRSPAAVSSLALLAAAALLPSQGFTRDARAGSDVIYQMEPMASAPAAAADDIIFELPPMRPVKRAQKPAPKPVTQQPAPVTAKPAPPPVAVAPGPTVEASPAVAPAPAPAEAAVQAAAEAPRFSEAAPASANGPPAPAQQPAAQPAAQVAAEQPPPMAEAPRLVEPASIRPPAMMLTAPHQSLAGVDASAVALDQNVIDLQGGAPAPTLVPGLPNVTAAPRIGAMAPVAAAPEDHGVVQVDADARLGQILAEGVAGPAELRLADRATMWLPAGRVYLPIEAAKKLADEIGMDWRPGVQGIVAPAGGRLEWLAPIEMIDDGHITADAAAPFAADKILAAFQASLPEINAARRKAGQSAITIDSWLAEPALTDKHRLSACVNIATEDQPDRFFNCEAWALGRSGAIKVGLADGGEQAARFKDEAMALADTIVFDHDKTYEDFDPAVDKRAPYAADDLLTRDVTARNAKPAPAPAPVEARAHASRRGGSLIKLLLLALAGGAVVLRYLRGKRRRAEDDDSTAARVARKVEKRAAQPDRPSLFARLLPTLYARFSKQPEQGASAEVASSQAASSQAASAPIVEKPDLVGPRGKLAGVRAGASARGEASAANDTEEPASALKRLATKMRKPSEEPAPAPVNVSRAIRGAARVAGAAAVAEKRSEALVVEGPPEDADNEFGLLEPGSAEAMRVQPTQPPEAQPAVARQAQGYDTFGGDDLGLVEPGQGVAPRRAIDG